MHWRLSLVLILAFGIACGGDDDGSGDGGLDGAPRDGASRDGETPDGDRPDGTPTDGATPDAPLPDGSRVDGGPSVCVPAMCQGRMYQCGNCLDDDSDGDIDARDGNCLGPCDNNEGGFDLGIPGGDSAPCKLDCYYDTDQGSGNDGCEWDARCDPLGPDSNPMCAPRDPPPPSARCPEPQSDACHDFCSPLTPNGCDCFGCCNLPARSDRWVFIGSTNTAGEPTCNLDVMDDDALCHPCTPNGDCINECGRCELCLGRDPSDIPADCFPPPPGDAGGVDGGPTPDAGTPEDPQCPPDRQACGLPGQGPCPDGFFCSTGCCIFFG